MTGMSIAIHPRMSWKGGSSSGTCTQQEEETSSSIQATLEKARAQRRAARFQLTVIPVTVGMIVFFITSAALIVFGVPLVGFLLWPNMLLFTYAILPSDKSAIKGLCVFTMMICLPIFLLYTVRFAAAVSDIGDDQCNAAHVWQSLDEEERVHCGWVVLFQIRQMGIALICGNNAARISRWLFTIKDSGPLLEKMIRLLGTGCLGFSVFTVLHLVALIGIDAGAIYVVDRLLSIMSMAICGVIFWYPNRLQSSLRTFLLSRIEHGTAASVAGFLGGHSPEHIQNTAKHLFKGVTLDLVEKEAMAKSSPDPLLFEKTIPATLGQVDAFVSHSWHDDSDLKWEQLQLYRADFKKANGGREPLVWIDKYCIDQNNLADGLMCLPVFLAGCNSLLVLAGSTYPRRMWCVMELFIFLVMGGSESAVDVRLLCNSLNTAEREALIQDLESFDAKEAKCSMQDDEDRMLGAIAGAFGSLEAFSRNVRKTLGSILRRGGSEVQQEVAQLRGRIVELEKANEQQAQKFEERFKQLEEQSAQQAQFIEELKRGGGGER